MLWSILIAGIPERYHTLQPLLYSLLEQQSVARMNDVELLYLMDTKKRSVGAKRNALLGMARGEYLSFIDDDDMVADDYVRRVHDAIVACRKRPEVTDVICFPQKATLIQEGVVHNSTYSLAHWKREPRRVLEPTADPRVFNWSGPPAHTMVWRADIVSGLKFPDKQFGEDADWVDEACAHAETEMQLEGEPLYFYNFDSKKTATR